MYCCTSQGTCSYNQYRCYYSSCINDTYLCDGTINCPYSYYYGPNDEQGCCKCLPCHDEGVGCVVSGVGLCGGGGGVWWDVVVVGCGGDEGRC